MYDILLPSTLSWFSASQKAREFNRVYGTNREHEQPLRNICVPSLYFPFLRDRFLCRLPHLVRIK